MERRKIISNGEEKFETYQVLKPRTDKEGFHEYGTKKSLSGIYYLLESGKFDVEISAEIKKKVSEYGLSLMEKYFQYVEKNFENIFRDWKEN